MDLRFGKLDPKRYGLLRPVAVHTGGDRPAGQPKNTSVDNCITLSEHFQNVNLLTSTNFTRSVIGANRPTVLAIISSVWGRNDECSILATWQPVGDVDGTSGILDEWRIRKQHIHQVTTSGWFQWKMSKMTAPNYKNFFQERSGSSIIALFQPQR